MKRSSGSDSGGVPFEKGELQVIHVAETIKGGIASYLRDLLPLQVRRYGEAKVALIVPREQAEDVAWCPGVEILAFPMSQSRIANAFRARRLLKRLLRTRTAKVLHLHSTFAGVSCRMPLGRKFDRLIYCPHGWSFIRTGGTRLFEKWIERLLALRTDAIVCVSDAERTIGAASGLPVEKLVTVRSGLPDIAVAKRPRDMGDDLPGVKKLLFVGRLDEAKGLDVLLAALERVTGPILLDVFGETVLGDLKVPRERAPESEARLVVTRFHGWQPFGVISDFLAEAHAVIVPSKWEALSLAAVEAMRSGKMVIASQVGGLVEVVEHGVTGILVPPNDPEALALAIENLTEESAHRMGECARRRFMQMFRVERAEEELSLVYAVN